ncbi:uncharacterized protein PV09_04191 [Verruconis gallopava]|uniref:RING-type domain-containing protein n=1 Tax=Verruconis gallopava TaxID=253628 RepID=A0A0D2AF16_9PEZI|nr:uncharacterized protein PV09_04191 [Verruconis gallopava]KIW05035.1 hypothetical protein PV09_04191 [Verruconis gallopava]
MSIPAKIIRTKSEGAECSICTNIIGQPREDNSIEAGIYLPCGHFFGLRCLARNVLERQTCPMCRTELPRDVVMDLRRVHAGDRGSSAAAHRHDRAGWPFSEARGHDVAHHGLLNVFGVNVAAQDVVSHGYDTLPEQIFDAGAGHARAAFARLDQQGMARSRSGSARAHARRTGTGARSMPSNPALYLSADNEHALHETRPPPLETAGGAHATSPGSGSGSGQAPTSSARRPPRAQGLADGGFPPVFGMLDSIRSRALELAGAPTAPNFVRASVGMLVGEDGVRELQNSYASMQAQHASNGHDNVRGYDRYLQIDHLGRPRP